MVAFQLRFAGEKWNLFHLSDVDADEIILVEARLQHLGFREQATTGEDLLLLQLLGGAEAIVGRV